jgi:Bacterial PH domain
VSSVRPARPPSARREIFRLAPPVVFWWVWVAFAVANVADFALGGVSARFAVVVTAILVTITGLAYVLALRPKVVADEVGVTVVNPFRVHHVPWTAVRMVDTGDWVRVHYVPPGAGPPTATSRVIYCWALYLPARTKRRAGRAPTRPFLAGLLKPQPGSAFAAEAASRLPEEARYLASLPPTKAISVRLDKRAARERARSKDAGRAQVAARWSWPAIAAVVIPALALLIIALI